MAYFSDLQISISDKDWGLPDIPCHADKYNGIKYLKVFYDIGTIFAIKKTILLFFKRIHYLYIDEANH